MLLATLGVWGVFGSAHAQQSVSLDECNETIKLTSEKRGTINLREKTTELGGVHISGCGATIRADSARTTSIDFADSSWTFDGDVQIEIGGNQGVLRSDKAVVTFRNNQIQQATITGTPAEFEHRRDGITTRGSAGRIVYELAAQKISLTDNAWVSDGGRLDVKAASLAYNLRTQDLAVDGKGSGRPYTIDIDPRAARKKNEEKKAEAKPPAGPDASAPSGTPRTQ